MAEEFNPSQELSDAAETESTPQDNVQTSVGDNASGVEALREEINRWQAKASENLDGWQRSQAEFANYKKRVNRDQAQANQNATASVVKRFLEVLDDLDLALKNRPKDGDGANWANGIELINRKLAAMLDSSGVTPLDAEGKFFDPNLHEAISHEDNPEFESGQIIEVIKQGYLIGERVLRPALVRVAK